MDFAGIARFHPCTGHEEPMELVFLARGSAATITHPTCGAFMAIVTHSVQSTAVMEAGTLPAWFGLRPVMVWVISILIIGSLSLAGDRGCGQKVPPPGAVNNRITGYSNVNRGVNTTYAAPSPPHSTAHMVQQHQHLYPPNRATMSQAPEPSYTRQTAHAPRPPLRPHRRG
jgi:hypothetical protein